MRHRPRVHGAAAESGVIGLPGHRHPEGLGAVSASGSEPQPGHRSHGQDHISQIGETAMFLRTKVAPVIIQLP